MFNRKKYDKKYNQEHKIPCIDCGKLIGHKVKSKLCKKCCRIEKKHHNYIDGKRCRYKKFYCLNCHKKIEGTSKRCKSCARKGKNNPRYRENKNIIIKHHIYLRENSSKTLKLSRSKHTQLHNRAYNYLVEMGLIKQYIKWFDKKYHLKEVLK